MDDERLLLSEGNWHRGQRKYITFQDSCYYQSSPDSPLGCQYGVSKNSVWTLDTVRFAQTQVLGLLYDMTGGSAGNWHLSDNWGDGDPCWDMWYGITCDEHGHVIAIELADNKLQGNLPGNLAQLTSLLKLDVSSGAEHYNGHPNRLRNRLYGELPSLYGASRLEEVDISGNLFDEWPGDLWMCGSTLRVLSASHNLFTSMPALLNRFTALHTLELSHNLIEGYVPSELGDMLEARYIHLDYNFFTGDLPGSLPNMGKIVTFDISHNPDLSGQLPELIITSWPNAYYISILNTSLTGYIADLCLDVPMCYTYNYDTHGDLSDATAEEIPDIVYDTIALAEELAAEEAAAAAAA